MINKLTELKQKIIEEINAEEDVRFHVIVDDALTEMYMVGVHVGWKSAGEKIIRMIKEEH